MSEKAGNNQNKENFRYKINVYKQALRNLNFSHSSHRVKQNFQVAIQRSAIT